MRRNSLVVVFPTLPVIATVCFSRGSADFCRCAKTRSARIGSVSILAPNPSVSAPFVSASLICLAEAAVSFASDIKRSPGRQTEESVEI